MKLKVDGIPSWCVVKCFTYTTMTAARVKIDDTSMNETVWSRHMCVDTNSISWQKTDTRKTRNQLKRLHVSLDTIRYHRIVVIFNPSIGDQQQQRITGRESCAKSVSMTMTFNSDIIANQINVVLLTICAMLSVRFGVCTKFSSIYKKSSRICYFSSSEWNVSPNVSNYFSEFQCTENLRLFPADLLRPSTAKEPPKPYLAIDSEAIKIADAINSRRKPNVPLLEVHPGPGILTKYLEKLDANTPLLLYEDHPDFVSTLKVCHAIAYLISKRSSYKF